MLIFQKFHSGPYLDTTRWERKRIRSNRKLNRLILPTWLASHQVNMQNEKYLLANWLQISEDVSLETGEPRELPWNVAMKLDPSQEIHRLTVPFAVSLDSDVRQSRIFSPGMFLFLGEYDQVHTVMVHCLVLVLCICYADALKPRSFCKQTEVSTKKIISFFF